MIGKVVVVLALVSVLEALGNSIRSAIRVYGHITKVYNQSYTAKRNIRVSGDLIRRVWVGVTVSNGH